ncbi:exo-alpha-sialidase [Streptomyces sp. NPDC059740]|uniref:sialidase family protein n=1 Tax=Streptomyces sp. NPDC059740 TaxID=3346926 RepID=UPI00366154E9
MTTAAHRHPAPTASVPFRKGQEGYDTYRIPAVVTSRQGTVLAFAEGRHDSGSDTGHIDTVLRRSTDGGLTWQPLQVVCEEPGQGTAGNPAPVVLDNGRIVLVTTHNAATATEQKILLGQVSAEETRRVWVQHSDDDGLTWSSAREITADVKKPDWRWYATTPGHGVLLRHGPHAGRIVVPCNHTTPPTGTDKGNEGKYNSGNSILSDDGGETWRLGYLDENPDGYVNVNESTGTELPDGRLYLNTRNDATSPGHRADAYSEDGGESLVKPFRPQAGLVTPICQGSVLALTDPEVLLFSGPADPEDRALMTVRASEDAGLTWRPAFTASGLPAAYSDLVRVDADTVGLLYETGDFSAYSTVTFQRIPVTALLRR